MYAYVRYEPKKVMFCNVIMTTIRYIVKKPRLYYNADTKLLCSCYGEAVKCNYTYRVSGRLTETFQLTAIT